MTPIIGIFLLILSANANNHNAEKYLLPGNIIPHHYDLRLNTYIERFAEGNYEYDGTVGITLTATEDNVTDIVINNSGLNITSSVLTVKGASPVSLGCGESDNSTQKHKFRMEVPLMKGVIATLNLTFVGVHRQNKQIGFYRTTFTEDGKKKTILNTQFQPAYARTAFPCFDEPRYKATYRISVSVSKEIISAGYRALSNTAEDRREQIDNRYIFHFKLTPLPISTYLIAILISDYKSSPPKYFGSTCTGVERKEFRTWGRETYIKQAKLAQSSGAALMDIYTEEYSMPYGFDKVDQAAVAEFPAGMENWGLIFYWEAILLATDDLQQETVTLIAHELAHQWFGNLVTCHYWSDIWLNEGFATYVEYFGTDKLITPEVNASSWRLPYQFVITVLQNFAFQMDIPGYTHPLTVEIYNPSELLYYFDPIEYHKGGSVIRMWTHVLGLDTFNKAIQLYLKENKGSVSNPDSLFSSFDTFINESASELPGYPSKIFKCWHLQEGYPLVHARKSLGPHPLYTFTQEVYHIRNSTRLLNHTWTIPISYSTSHDIKFNDTRATHWMTNGEPLSILLDTFADWIVVNNQQTGYYRVNYDPSNWRALLNVLFHNSTIIHELNRAQIIDDAANLAKSTAFNYVPYSFFMELTTYLEVEDSYYPWKAALNNFEYLNAMLSKDRESYRYFKTHILNIINGTYKKLSFSTRPEDAFSDKQLRLDIISWACRMGNLDCLENSRKIFKNSLTNESDTPAYLMTTMYCSAVRSTDGLWDELWKSYIKTENVSAKSILIYGLTCTRNDKSLVMLLNRTVDDKVDMENGERLMIFSLALDRNTDNIQVILDFVTKHYKKMIELYGGIFDELFTKLAKFLGTNDEVSKVKTLLTEINSIDDKTKSKVIEIVEANNLWLNIRKPDILLWLTTHYQ